MVWGTYGEGVGVYATLLQLDTLYPYGLSKTDTRPVGVELHKKPKDLSVSEREDRGHGEGGSVYGTLLQSDTIYPYGHAKSVTRPRGGGLRKKPKDLSTSERENRGHGRVWVCILLCYSQIQYSHMCVYYVIVRYSTVIWSHIKKTRVLWGLRYVKTKEPQSKCERGAWHGT